MARLLMAGLLLLAAAPGAGAQVTFARDVAPIVFARCVSCHRAGSVGPFPLTTYREVRQRAALVADVTARRAMPPWKPRGDPDLFAGARVLTDAEIQTIRDWVQAGAPEGDPADLPPLPDSPDRWQLGQPDVVVQMPEPYVLRADGPDVFRTFVLPIPVSTARFVRAVEFQPGNARVVHHANLGVDRTRSSRRLDARDREPGYEGGMVRDAAYPPGHMLGWTPGQQPRAAPDGMAWRLEAGSDLVAQLHLQPSGRPEPVQVSAGFYFDDRPPSRTPVGLRLGSQTIDIAAGDADYTIADSYALPVDVELLAIQPHAHHLARHVTAAARLPDGTTRPLLDIGDWDFRWQDVYRYARPVVLPRGTVLSMRVTYDNSAANPRNPFQPPRRIVWGQNTTDEMGDVWFQLVARAPADLAALLGDVERRQRTADLAAYLKILADEPRNPLRHDQVGTLYLTSGDAAAAIAHFRDSLRLNPESAPTRYNLGIALSLARRRDEALAEFRAAIRLDPGHAGAHNNAGALLHVAGKLEEAATHYRRAIALDPDNADAPANLGRLLSTTGQDAEAVRAFRQALAVRPDHVSALAGLGWVLATTGEARLGDAAEAIRAAEQASVLTGGGDPNALDALAAAYASGGDFARAEATAGRAVEAAMRAGLPALADQVRRRLDLYRERRPYRR